MSGAGVQSLALALANNPNNYPEDGQNSRKGQKQNMGRRKPLLKCSCDLRYCNQNYCMTEGVCFASARRKHRKKGWLSIISLNNLNSGMGSYNIMPYEHEA